MFTNKIKGSFTKTKVRSKVTSVIKKITYQDPCAALFQFTENAQSNVASDTATGDKNGDTKNNANVDWDSFT